MGPNDFLGGTLGSGWALRCDGVRLGARIGWGAFSDHHLLAAFGAHLERITKLYIYEVRF